MADGEEQTRAVETTDPWGSSGAEWFGVVFPRLQRFLPTGNVLEIAPRPRRWTRHLIPLCNHYVGIDKSQDVIAACQATHAQTPHAQFLKNDGRSLVAVDDGRYDLVFSFETLAHEERHVLDTYLSQALRKLNRDGVAFIHHSNLFAFGGAIGVPHGRAQTVSAALVAETVAGSGGKVILQELINWGGHELHDCLTLFSRAESHWPAAAKPVGNRQFMQEVTIAKQVHGLYAIEATPGASPGV